MPWRCLHRVIVGSSILPVQIFCREQSHPDVGECLQVRAAARSTSSLPIAGGARFGVNIQSLGGTSSPAGRCLLGRHCGGRGAGGAVLLSCPAFTLDAAAAGCRKSPPAMAAVDYN